MATLKQNKNKRVGSLTSQRHALVVKQLCIEQSKIAQVVGQLDQQDEIALFTTNRGWLETPITILDNYRTQIHPTKGILVKSATFQALLTLEEALEDYQSAGLSVTADTDTIYLKVSQDETGIKSPMQHRAHATASGAKSELNEIAQKLAGDGVCMPVYKTSRTGPAHIPNFHSIVAWNGKKGRGTATTKRQAEEEAALDILNKGPWPRDLTRDGDVESNPGPCFEAVIQTAVLLTGLCGLTAMLFWGLDQLCGDKFSNAPQGWVRDLSMDGDVELNPGPTTAFSAFYLDTTGSSHVENIPLTAGTYHVTGNVTVTPSTVATSVGNVFLTSSSPAINVTLLHIIGTQPQTINVNTYVTVTGPLTLTTTVGSVAVGLYTTVNLVFTNDTAPISLPVTVSGGNVTIDPASLPLWTTEHNPKPQQTTRRRRFVNRRKVKKDLTKDGDVEKNPGPGSERVIQRLSAGDFMTHQEPIDMDAIRDQLAANPMQASKVVQQTDDFGLPIKATIAQYHDHVLHVAKMSGKIGDYFKVLALSLGLDPENRFSLLTLDETIPSEPNFEFVPSRPKPQQSREPKERKEKRVITPKPQTPPMSEEEKARQYKAVIDRITEKLSDRSKVIAWLSKPMTTKFKLAVLDALFGQGWQTRESMDQYEYWSYCHVNNVPDSVRTHYLAQFDVKIEEYRHLVANSESQAAEALLHNKIMHAYNGNPVNQNFAQVRQLMRWTRILEDNNDVMLTQAGRELESFITNVDGNINPNSSSLAQQDRLRGNMVTAANAIVQNVVVCIPNTNLIPRQLRPVVAGAAVPTTRRLVTIIINMSEYYSNALRATQLSKDMSLAVSNNQTSNWRRDNTSLAGFSMFDCFSINSIVTPKGLSLETMLLKLDLLHSTLSNIQQANYIPRSVYTAIDQRSLPAAANPVLGINNSPIANETCGGNNPVYPYGGGTGQINFHLTLQSVPIDRRDDAVFMPSALLMSSIDAQQAIALFAMSFSEYPFGLYTITKATTDLAGGNPGNTVYVPTSTLVRVPGQQILDIVLPRRYSEQNPTAQGTANSQAVIQPTAGPAASANMAANAPLNINFVGGAAQAYNLTDYLYTWALAFDTTTIANYVSQIGAIMGVKDQMEAVHEMTVSLTQLFPSLISSDTQANAVPAFDTPQSMELSFCSHGIVTPATQDYPQPSTLRSNYRIFETNPSSWNKVVLGLATADNLQPEGANCVPDFVANPKNNFWERLIGLTFATPWKTYYTARGLTAEAWDTGYTNNQIQFIQNTVRHTFCTAADSGAIIPARFSKYVNNGYKAMYHKGFKLVTTRNLGGETRNITSQDRWLPHAAYSKVYNAAGAVVYNGMIPSILVDIWSDISTKDEPIMMGSFPPPAGEDSTQGFAYKEGLEIHRNMALDIVAPFVDKDLRATYNLDEGPNVSDFSRWNERLWFTQPVRQILDYAGGALAAIFVPQGQFAMQRLPALNPGENLPLGVAPALTTNLAVCDSVGRRILPYLTQANASVPVNACISSARLARDAWLLAGIMSEPQIQARSGQKDIFERSYKPQDFQNSIASDTAPPPTSVTEQAVPTIASDLLLEVSPIITDQASPANT
nr:MAG: putative coat protein [Totiviridae sp.]